jgi:integrase
MARKTLTDKGVAALKAKPKLYAHPDPQMPGHYVRVSPSGSKTYYAVARDPRGKQVWTAIGNAAHIKIEAAREKAREVIARVKSGQDRAGPQSFEAVSNKWLKRHVEAKQLRSAPALISYLNRFVLPAWGGREFTSIRRGDIASLMDHVEDKAGPVAADRMLTMLSSIFNWYATRHDDYASPIVRGMKRTTTKERARTRILSDDEIKTVWNACEGTMGDVVKLLLLTAQRREKVVSMKWDDVSVDGTWNVRNGNREKGTGGELVLPAMAVDIIRSRPRFASNEYVFPGPGDGYFTSYAAGKLALDKATGDLPHWQLHDLRRTARSLMSRAGVRREIAEQVLGHVIPGVEGTYDRHGYVQEKADALRKLAGLLETILRPSADNVVALRG